MGSNTPNAHFELIKNVITIDTTLSKTLEETNQRLSNIVTKIQSGALTSNGDLTVNEEISRIITNNINQTFNENRLSIVNNVIQKVFADSRMLSAISNTIAEDDDFTEKISKELTTKTDAV
jgi:aromatic ring-opening dioxygenase LigB subunit